MAITVLQLCAWHKAIFLYLPAMCAIINTMIINIDLILFLKRFYLFIFREKEEIHQCERETSIGCLSPMPQVGTEPTTKACALTGNQTHALLLCGMKPNQLSHTSQGKRWDSWNLFFHICVVSTFLYTSDKSFVLYLVLCELQLLRKTVLLMWPNNDMAFQV